MVPTRVAAGDETKTCRTSREDGARSPLARLLMPHEVYPIRDPAGRGQAVWMQADGWRILASPRLDDDGAGRALARFTLPDGRAVFARVLDESGMVAVPFNLTEAYENFVAERWRAGTARAG